MAADVVRVPPPTTPRNPPAEAWLAIKAVFLDLYLRQDKTLDEVRYYLQKHHSFTASTKAYKLRVKQWRAFKYRKRQRPKIINTSGCGLNAPASGHGSEQLNLSNKPPSWEGQILNFSDTLSTRGFQPREFTNQMIRMDRRIHDESGYLFAAARDFWQWTIQSDSSPKMDHVWSSHLAPSWGLIDAVTLLSMPSRHDQGRMKLLEVQESISSTVKDSPAATLLALISLFTFNKWHPYPGVQLVIFNYIRNYVLKCLPPDHPLKKIFEYANGEEMRQVAGRLLVVQVDTLMEIQKTGHQIPDWFFFAPTLGLLQARLLSDAHRVSMMRLHRTKSKLKRCRILEMVIRGQFYSHDFDGCIVNAKSIVEMLQELLAEGNYVWGDLVSTYDVLAKCYDTKSDWEQMIEYYWLAFKTALKQYGQYATNVQYYCHELETSLTKHGTPEEIQALKSDYAFMFSNESVPAKVDDDDDEPKTNRAYLKAGTVNLEQALRALINI